MFLTLVVLYSVEHIRLLGFRRRIPLRICVTGARGKSSVVRLLAAVLRESGRSVLAKTTGSRPMLILPDGSETELYRGGRPSVLEQLRVLRLAAALEADAVVVEMMSIRPEILSVESRRLVNPSILIVTNARPDHREHWGPNRETAARCLAAAVSPESDVFIPNEEATGHWNTAAARTGAGFHPVNTGPAGGENEGPRRQHPGRTAVPGLHFDADLRLVEAVADHLRIDPVAVREGIRKACPDMGALKVWRWRKGPGAPEMDCVSAFAANDPESTREVLRVLAARDVLNGRPVIGLLALRRDRGDRTQQWLEAFRGGLFPEIRSLCLIGDRSRAFERGMSALSETLEARAVPDRKAEGIMAALSGRISEPSAVVFGMGNMGGVGRELVEFWEKEGADVGV